MSLSEVAFGLNASTKNVHACVSCLKCLVLEMFVPSGTSTGLVHFLFGLSKAPKLNLDTGALSLSVSWL